MSAKTSLLRVLITSVLLAVFIVFIVNPKVSLGTVYDISLIAVVEIAAVFIARTITTGKVRGQIIRILLLSVAFAAIIVYVLQPASPGLSFDMVVLYVLGIEVFGLILSSVLVYSPSSSARPGP